MKKSIAILVALLANICVFSQARLTTAEFQKVMQPAIETEMLFGEKTITDAVEAKMQKLGYKGKEYKGYIVYKGVTIPDFKNNTYDLYFKAARKSRKEKENSYVTLLISTGYEKFVGDTSNSDAIEQGKKFLDNLMPVVEAHDLELQIADQESATQKAEKKLNNLVSDGEDLVKKKEKLEKEIEENIKKVAEQKVELENQKQIGNTLKAKRKL